MRPFLSLTIASLAAGASAQDSVSKTGCLPGDGVSPWQDASFALGSEQGNAYVVDLAPLISSWGNSYGVAPLIKSSKTTGQFFGAILSANGMSRLQAKGVPFASASYSSWAGPGFGVNNDPALNDAGTPVDTSSALGHRFAVATSEFSDNHNGIVSGIVHVDPTDPGRLYVDRRVTAVNGCDDSANLSQFGFGSVDESGCVVFRTDDFGVEGGCGLTPISNNNVFRVEAAQRDTSALNVISFESFPPGGGLTDVGATDPILALFNDVANTPGVVPASVTGGDCLYVGTDFSANYVRGSDIASVTLDQTHLAPGTSDQRGGVSWSEKNYPFLGNTAGTCAVLGRTPAGETRIMNLFGIEPGGAVTGTRGLELPGTLTDNCTGFTNPGGASNQFANYFSQVPFRGGNGQIALGRDQTARLIAAATVDHPSGGSASNIGQYIAVARLNPATGVEEWAIAAYNDGVGGGKPILNGPGGATIGTLSDFGALDGSARPGISSPMVDSVGNIYFIAVVDTTASGGGLGTGLVRAVYDPSLFCYELELLFDTGTVLSGPNSGRNYQISFIELSDSNSISSGTTYSQNISETAHLSMCPQGLGTSDPRTLGGLVLALEIVYDFDGDGLFTQCTGALGDPLSADQDYTVLFYVGATGVLSDVDGDGQADESEMLSGDVVALSVAGGGSQSLSLNAGLENAGRTYAFAGTVSGTSPGFPFGGLAIPLNPDGYFNFLINKGFLGSTPFGATFSGTLSTSGKASATWTIPADNSLIGLTAQHVYGVFDPLPVLADISNPWPVQILP
ncbi:MAG: hypothetical protein AAF682_26355 [Planctomycetota bacterium]